MSTEAARNLLPLGAGAGAVASGGGVVRARRRGGQMRDIFRHRMLGANVGDANVRSFAGLAQGIVA